MNARTHKTFNQRQTVPSECLRFQNGFGSDSLGAFEHREIADDTNDRQQR